MAIGACILAGFAIAGTGLVALTYTATQGRIAANEQAALLANLNALVPPERYDNDVTEDYIQVIAPEFLGTSEPVTIYRAYRGTQPVALFATPTAPDGYSGPIKLLIGVYADGTLAGVRVLRHKETPGLGDAIEIERSDWIRTFEDRSLGNPPLKHWQVRKDGGVFDQFTGATITPRAVVQAVKKFLLYFQHNRNQLFIAERVTQAEQSDE